MAWIKEIVMAGIITVIACAGIFELLERRKRAAFKEQIHDLAQKYIRIKRVKVNGGRAQRDQRLSAGDVLQLYINDEFFDKPSEENLFLTLFKPHLTVV